MDHERARKLLEDTHNFPGRFEFRVIIDPPFREQVLDVMGEDPALSVIEVSDRPSRTGAYISLRVITQVETAETVLAAWGRLKGTPGVVMTL